MAHDGHSGKIEDAMTLYGLHGHARACAGAVLVVVLLWGGPAAAQDGLPAGAFPRLDLRPGDLRRHVPRDELSAPWTESLDEVVIRPRRQPPDLPERRAVPQGLGGLFWAATRPAQAWRLIVPDPNAPPVPPRSVDDPREPPGAYRSRIGEPGRTF
jgi:hypothetical protein